MSEGKGLSKNDFSSASVEKLCSAINKTKLIFMIKIYPGSKSVRLYVWGYKIGYTSYRLADRDKYPWDLTFCDFSLDEIGNNDYDDMTSASELFGFTEDMSKEERFIKWRELYSDASHWKLSCRYDDFCEDHFSKKELCAYLHNEIKENNLQKIYIFPKNNWSDVYDYGKNIMISFLDENTNYYSEFRGLE